MTGFRQRMRLAARVAQQELRGKRPFLGSSGKLLTAEKAELSVFPDVAVMPKPDVLPHLRLQQDALFAPVGRERLPPPSSSSSGHGSHRSLAPTSSLISQHMQTPASLDSLLSPEAEERTTGAPSRLLPHEEEDRALAGLQRRQPDPSTATPLAFMGPTPHEEVKRLNRRLMQRSADPTNFDDDAILNDASSDGKKAGGKGSKRAAAFDDDERGLAGLGPDTSFMHDDLDVPISQEEGEWLSTQANFDPSTIEQPLNPHFLRVRLVGPANAGKSTLINHLLGSKVAAVSNKSQTTRRQQMCILSQGNVQVAIRDTAGLPRNSRQRESLPDELLRSAFQDIEEDDVVLAVLDAAMAFTQATLDMVSTLTDLKSRYPDKTFVLVLNKADLLGSAKEVAYTMRGVNQTNLFDVGFSISAINHINVDDLQRFIFSLSKPGEWQYPENTKTLISHGQQALEVIREKVFRRVAQEVPYGATFELTSWTYMPDSSLRIRADIYTQKRNHMKILIGSGGSNLHIITNSAQEELKHMWGRPVLLKLFVRGVTHERHQFEEKPLLVLPSQVQQRQMEAGRAHA